MTSLTRQHLLPSSTLVPALLFFVASFFPAHIEAGNLARLFSSSACKTVNTSDPFDLKNYTAHPWYVQQQQVINYQPLDSLFCVRASYTLAEGGGSVSVLNTANVGGVKGPAQNADMMRLRALVEDTSGQTPPSKLLVGPNFLPRFAYGPYWVVAVSPSEPRAADDPAGEGYDWAVVSGGQPTIPSGLDDGRLSRPKCKNGEGTNGSGLWLLTRDKVASEAVVAEMRAVVDQNGFDASVLNPVEQEGCTYPEEV